MATANEASFTISVIGEVTGEKWLGIFKVKVRLSHRDYIAKDKIRREFLGPHPEGASERAVTSAEILSQLAVRIIEAPAWWAASNNGLDLNDDAVILEIYNAAIKAETDTAEALKKKAAEAEAELKKQPEPAA